jgi:hypothetical protein|tara:strand:+ start:4494 stop:4718 length:225 start_codon:yes stop_codon:yes gene_type:complete
MISSDYHRVLILDYFNGTINAIAWCEEFLELDDWTVEYFDNYECFYFTSKTICSMFLLTHGGKYIPAPRGAIHG